MAGSADCLLGFHAGFPTPGDSWQQSSIGAKQPDVTLQFEQLRSSLTADLAKMQADLVARIQADFISKTDLMESMQRMIGDSLTAAMPASNPSQQASDSGQQELRSIVDGAVSEIKADSSSRQQEISNICTELCTSLEAAQSDGEKEAEEITSSLAELRTSVEAAQADLKTQHEEVQETCSSLQGFLREITADVAAQQTEMSTTCADLRRCVEKGQQQNDMQHDVLRKTCAGIQSSSDDSHAVMRTQCDGLEAAASGIRASVKETRAEVKEMAAAVRSLDVKVSELRKSADQVLSQIHPFIAGLRDVSLHSPAASKRVTCSPLSACRSCMLSSQYTFKQEHSSRNMEVVHSETQEAGVLQAV